MPWANTSSGKSSAQDCESLLFTHVRALFSKYSTDPFSLWSSNKQHHIKPVFFFITKTLCIMRSVGINLAYKIFISEQPVSRFLSRWPRLWPHSLPCALHNFPQDTTLSLSHYTLLLCMYRLLTLLFNFSLLCPFPPSVCVSFPLSTPL